jgi:hypothetical protein
MKKIVLISIAALAALNTLPARDHGAAHRTRGAKPWLDAQFVQHFGLDRWNDTDYAADGFPATSITELRGVFNFHPFRRSALGLFADMGLGVMPAPAMRSLNLDRMPVPNSGTRYYLRETLSESGTNGTTVHLKMATGLFADIRAGERLGIVPHLGVGFMTMPTRRYEVVLKEEGSNMQYNAFNANVRKSFTATGNRVNMLAVSLGVSFK